VKSLAYVTSEPITKTQNASNPQQLAMSQPNYAKSSNQEGRILLAEQAIKLDQIQSIRRAAVLHDVAYTILYE
jgi:hypothetical protein